MESDLLKQLENSLISYQENQETLDIVVHSAQRLFGDDWIKSLPQAFDDAPMDERTKAVLRDKANHAIHYHSALIAWQEAYAYLNDPDPQTAEYLAERVPVLEYWLSLFGKEGTDLAQKVKNLYLQKVREQAENPKEQQSTDNDAGEKNAETQEETPVAQEIAVVARNPVQETTSESYNQTETVVPEVGQERPADASVEGIAPSEVQNTEEIPTAQEENVTITEQSEVPPQVVSSQEEVAVQEKPIEEVTSSEILGQEETVTQEKPAEEKITQGFSENIPTQEELIEEILIQKETVLQETPTEETVKEIPAQEEPTVEETPVQEKPIEEIEKVSDQEESVTQEDTVSTPVEEIQQTDTLNQEPSPVAQEEKPLETTVEEVATQEGTPVQEEVIQEESVVAPVIQEEIATVQKTSDEENTIQEEASAQEKPVEEFTGQEETSEKVVTQEEIPSEEIRKEQPVQEETTKEEVTQQETTVQEVTAIQEEPVEETSTQEEVVVQEEITEKETTREEPVEETPAKEETSEEVVTQEEIPSEEIVQEETSQEEPPQEEKIEKAVEQEEVVQKEETAIQEEPVEQKEVSETEETETTTEVEKKDESSDEKENEDVKHDEETPQKDKLKDKNASAETTLEDLIELENMSVTSLPTAQKKEAPKETIDPQIVSQNWDIAAYIKQKELFDSANNWLSAWCIRMDNAEKTAYPFYGFIVDLMHDLKEKAQLVLENQLLEDLVDREIPDGRDGMKRVMEAIDEEFEYLPDEFKTSTAEKIKLNAREILGKIDTSTEREIIEKAPDGFELMDDPYEASTQQIIEDFEKTELEAQNKIDKLNVIEDNKNNKKNNRKRDKKNE
ncbi:MAG: hypothetical protein J6Y03_04740 [Alphaproteobacteria bacterium]|nr:hypothetical protein [Alphaproteobacteria bacterium]